MGRYATEEAVIKRLQDSIPSLKTVEGFTSLDDAFKRPQGLPAALVLYGGGKCVNSEPSSGALVDRLWDVVLVVQAIGDSPHTKALAREAALDLGDEVEAALIGFEPTERSLPMELVSEETPDYRAGGRAVFALSFSCREPTP
jgi:hypothetical protein